MKYKAAVEAAIEELDKRNDSPLYVDGTASDGSVKLRRLGSEELDPTGLSSTEKGAKLDAGKSPIMQGVIQYFPRALQAVADLSGVGAKKYSWDGWREVPDGINRYSDAMARHLLDEAIEGPVDNGPGGSGELHATAVAWNALARLERMLCESE